jgi:hypothetical protein
MENDNYAVINSEYIKSINEVDIKLVLNTVLSEDIESFTYVPFIPNIYEEGVSYNSNKRGINDGSFISFDTLCRKCKEYSDTKGYSLNTTMRRSSSNKLEYKVSLEPTEYAEWSICARTEVIAVFVVVKHIILKDKQHDV